jgi:hypothetical protein
MRQREDKRIEGWMLRRRQWLFFLLAAATLAFSRPCSAADEANRPCTYYASPAGKGDGKTPDKAFPVASF